RDLVSECRVVGGAGLEPLVVGHLDEIVSRLKRRLRVAVADVGPKAVEEVLRQCVPLGGREPWCLGQGETFDLACVKDRVALGDEDPSGLGLFWSRFFYLLLLYLPEHDRSAPFTLSHLGSEFGPLLVGAPQAIIKALLLGTTEQRQDVDPAVRGLA